MASIDTEQLRTILKDFYTLTRIRIALMDHNAQEELSFPAQRCPLCEMIRQHPALDEKCRQCDYAAFERCKNSAAPLVYTCHAGLLEVIIPIRIENQVLCYVMCGQMFDSDALTQQQEATCRYLLESGLPEVSVRGAIGSVDVRSREVIRAAVTVLESLALFCLTKQLIRPGKNHFLEELNAYIDAHMAGPICIADLCAHFFISRTQLYKLARPHLDCTLAEYVQRRRIQHAQRMLGTTGLSVAEVASACGFADASYFGRVYRRVTGQAPGEKRIAAQSAP